MKKFRSRKLKNNILLYVGLFLISVAFSIKYLYQEGLINNNTLIASLFNNNLNTYNQKITDVDFLLKYALDIDLQKKEEDVPVFKDNIEKENPQNDITEDNNKILEPILYLYSTHPEEKYQSGLLEPYNITPDVFIASKMFKEYLEDEGIGVILEENKVSDKLKELKWAYGQSYKVSRMFMDAAKENNPSLKYFIDFHRDSSIYEVTTTNIDGESYAKILFVIGLDHENYEYNLAYAEDLRKKIIEYNADLFRGIMKKSGKGVNGIYNQDFSQNTILIEMGGQYNNIREVNNTLKVLAKIVADFIRERENG